MTFFTAVAALFTGLILGAILVALLPATAERRRVRRAFAHYIEFLRQLPFGVRSDDDRASIEAAFEEYLRVRWSPSLREARDLREFHNRVSLAAADGNIIERYTAAERLLGDAIRPLPFPFLENGLALAFTAMAAIYVISVANPRLASAPASHPVYNARLEPNGGEPNTFLDRVPTRVLFSLGPPSPESFITYANLSDRLWNKITGNRDLDLLVTMTCHVCSEGTQQTLPIRFLQARQASTTAVFQITPDLRRILPETEPAITFSIDRNGVETGAGVAVRHQ